MLQLSEKMPIFAPSDEKDWRHQGELFSFDPPEDFTYTGIPALGDEGDAFEEKSEKEPSG